MHYELYFTDVYFVFIKMCKIHKIKNMKASFLCFTRFAFENERSDFIYTTKTINWRETVIWSSLPLLPLALYYLLLWSDESWQA